VKGRIRVLREHVNARVNQKSGTLPLASEDSSAADEAPSANMTMNQGHFRSDQKRSSRSLFGAFLARAGIHPPVEPENLRRSKTYRRKPKSPRNRPGTTRAATHNKSVKVVWIASRAGACTSQASQTGIVQPNRSAVLLPTPASHPGPGVDGMPRAAALISNPIFGYCAVEHSMSSRFDSRRDASSRGRSPNQNPSIFRFVSIRSGKCLRRVLESVRQSPKTVETDKARFNYRLSAAPRKASCSAERSAGQSRH
jgi:hypothetical protein